MHTHCPSLSQTLGAFEDSDVISRVEVNYCAEHEVDARTLEELQKDANIDAVVRYV
jgi:hypothetical protein